MTSAFPSRPQSHRNGNISTYEKYGNFLRNFPRLKNKNNLHLCFYIFYLILFLSILT